MHLFQVARVFNCEFPIEEVASFLHDPVTSTGQAKSGTTSTEEMSAAKSYM
ncbi:hypothetical protein [Clostridium diolis]|uniref:hypothetical protein n=1 Tax=Clostridium diolis TaxID=223919 RepID=UPI003AF98729